MGEPRQGNRQQSRTGTATPPPPSEMARIMPKTTKAKQERKPCRRQTTPAMQQAELALRLKEAVAAEAKKRQVSPLKKGNRKPVCENSHEREERTDEQLATMAGVSSNTIRRVEKIVAQAAPAVVEAARTGDAENAAATPGKGASMQTNEQTTNTPAPYKAKRKDAARRKERRKARKAAQKTEAHFAKQGVPREIRKWLHF